MSDENQSIIDLVKGLRESLDRLNQKVDIQNNKISTIENKILALENYTDNNTTFEEMPSSPPPPPPPPKYISREAEDTSAGRTASMLEGVMHMNKYTEDKKEGPVERGKGDTNSTLKAKKDQGSLEEVIGGKWFAKIGIVVTILGMSFFLKYAFDNEWIGETGRVILGILAGLSLLAFGERTIRKYFLYGQIVSGGGLAIIYLSVFASYNFYHLVSQPVAFMFMGLVTMIGIALSIRYNAPSLIIFSTLGGFATPFLVNSNVNNQIGLFSYIAILDMAVLAVSYFKRWRWLNLIGFVGTIMVFSAWHGAYYTAEQLTGTMVFAAVFFLIYSLSSLIYNLVNKEMSTGFEQLMTLFTGLSFFGYSYSILDPGHHVYMGFFALLMAVYYFIWAYSVKAITPKDANLYNFLAFLSIGFITIAIPLQFSKFVITISWLIEAALLLYAGSRQTDKSGEVIKILGLVVMTLALIRVAFVDLAYYNKLDVMFFNKVFLSAFVAILAQYLVALAFKKAPEAKEGFVSIFQKKQVVTLFLIMASLVTVFSVTREIITYNYNQIRVAQDKVNELNRNIMTEQGNHREYMQTLDKEQVKRVEERSAASVSVFWIIYGIFILSVGMSKHKKSLAVFGTALCVLVVVKLTAYELWEMESFYRPIISASAIFASYFVAVIYYLHSKTGEDNTFLNPVKVFALFIVIANVLTIFAVSRDLYVYHDNLMEEYNNQSIEVCRGASSYSKYSSAGGVNQSEECTEVRAQIKRLQNRASISISLFWLIYAIILVAIGFIKRYKWVRIGGIVLLGVAIFKLFFMDLWSLGQLYRIIASISLGLVLLAISFVYQKYRSIFNEIIKD